MRKHIALTAAAALTMSAFVATPASADPYHISIDVQKVTTTQTIIKADCPHDPPQIMLSFYEFDGQQAISVLAPITCNNKMQRYYLTTPPELGLEPGDLVYVTAVMSGDSGEMSTWGWEKVKR